MQIKKRKGGALTRQTHVGKLNGQGQGKPFREQASKTPPARSISNLHKNIDPITPV